MPSVGGCAACVLLLHLLTRFESGVHRGSKRNVAIDYSAETTSAWLPNPERIEGLCRGLLRLSSGLQETLEGGVLLYLDVLLRSAA